MIRLFASILIVIAISCCAHNNDEEARLLAKAESVSSFPVKRSNLIAALELEEALSHRMGGSVRSGTMYFTETWHHQSGLKVTAYDTEYVGTDWYVVGKTIDEVLNDPNLNIEDFFRHDHPRATFRGFSIIKEDETLYTSPSKEGEQDGAE